MLMAYRKTFRGRRPAYRRVRAAPVPKRTQRLRKMVGQKPLSWPETIAKSAGPIGHLAASVATIAGLVNSEVKYIDTTFSSQAVDNTGNACYVINDCAEGDTENQRNGKFILDKGINYKLRVLADTTTPNTAMGWCIVYIKDWTQVGLVTAGLQWTDVFNSVDCQALMNKNVSDNYVIVKRGLCLLDNVGNVQRELKGYINLKGIHTKYNAATTGQIQKGAIAIMFVSDHATLYPHVNGTIRFLFHDN